MSSSALSLVGWFIVPRLVTYYTQFVYYKITVPVDDPAPAPGSPKYERHKRRIHTAVIMLYLIYSIVESVWNVTNPLSSMSTHSGLYGALEVDPEVSASDLRRAFRQLSLKFHPDKVIGSGPEIEEKWLQIKASYDMLSNPVLRYGYDRFGEKAMVWSKRLERGTPTDAVASSMSEFVMLGLQDSLIGFYGGSFLVLTLMALFGIAKTGHSWRFYILIMGALIELLVITRSTPMLHSMFPVMKWLGLAPYQLIQVLRNLMLTSFVAINQLGPLIPAGPGNFPLHTKKGMQQFQKQLELVELLSTNVSYESTQAFAHQMIPLQNDPQLVSQVKTKLAEELIEKRLSEDIFMKDAMKNLDKQQLLVNAKLAALNVASEPVTSESLGGVPRKRK